MGACLLREKNEFFFFLVFHPLHGSQNIVNHVSKHLFLNLYELLSGEDVFFVVAISLFA